MKNFYEIASKAGTDKVNHHGYHFFYPKYLSELENENFKMLEIGYQGGHSAFLWEEYFPKSEIFFMDKNHEGEFSRHKVIKGDQENLSDLKKVIAEIGSAKLIIDDGSHHPIHQYETFNVLFRYLLEPGGIYIIEDIECNYWKSESNIYGYRIGFFNAIKKTTELIDSINSEFSKVNNELNISTITYAQNCIIITKRTDEETKYFDRKYRFF